jgi:hypothetical protein
MIVEIRELLKTKLNYFIKPWSYVQIGLITCAWTYLGMYAWRYREYKRISQLFRETNGYSYINLQLCTYINDAMFFLLAFSTFFATIRTLRLCQFHSRLALFITTIGHAAKSLISFMLMFGVIFMAFLCLFYFLFQTELVTCSTLLRTAGALFEMSLLKFDAQQLKEAASFLGPFCFSLFILVVVFVCLSMFLSIITESFRYVRENTNTENDKVFSVMWRKLIGCIGQSIVFLLFLLTLQRFD